MISPQGHEKSELVKNQNLIYKRKKTHLILTSQFQSINNNEIDLTHLTAFLIQSLLWINGKYISFSGLKICADLPPNNNIPMSDSHFDFSTVVLTFNIQKVHINCRNVA